MRAFIYVYIIFPTFYLLQCNNCFKTCKKCAILILNKSTYPALSLRRDCMIHSEETSKSGYLHQNFRLFHLKDKKNMEFDFHYHDFNKIIIFLSGNVTYLVEGKAYYLKPWDILLVNHHAIHKPIICSDCTYERIVIWLKNEFIESQHSENCDISTCFTQAGERSFNLIRTNSALQSKIQSLIYDLETSLADTEFGSDILSTTYFLQLMVYLNRVFQHSDNTTGDESVCIYDKQIADILHYINSNLCEDLSNDALANRFYMNKYHLMHKFKSATGYTVHNYIQQKRLIHSAELIKSGQPVTKAALDSGFKDYSTYLRAFRKMFGTSPKNC